MAVMGELTQGMKVRSSDGASLGKIIRIDAGSFIVEKGFFFPKDYEISTTLVSGVRDDEAWLSVSQEELEREGGFAREETAATGPTHEGEQRRSSRRRSSRPGSASARRARWRYGRTWSRSTVRSTCPSRRRRSASSGCPRRPHPSRAARRSMRRRFAYRCARRRSRSRSGRAYARR
jgi:hypothetical protein